MPTKPDAFDEVLGEGFYTSDQKTLWISDFINAHKDFISTTITTPPGFSITLPPAGPPGMTALYNGSTPQSGWGVAEANVINLWAITIPWVSVPSGSSGVLAPTALPALISALTVLYNSTDTNIDTFRESYKTAVTSFFATCTPPLA